MGTGRDERRHFGWPRHDSICRMTEILVRTLSEDEWEQFRAARLAALAESPEAFVSSLAVEQEYDEATWRARMRRAQRLLAEVDGSAVGVASVGTMADTEGTAELFGLWVVPAWRGRGVAAALVRSGSEQARSQSFDRVAYWVGTDNGRAVAFASSFGFRPTGRRRPMRVVNDEDGEEETAMVLALGADRA